MALKAGNEVWARKPCLEGAYVTSYIIPANKTHIRNIYNKNQKKREVKNCKSNIIKISAVYESLLIKYNIFNLKIKRSVEDSNLCIAWDDARLAIECN